MSRLSSLLDEARIRAHVIPTGYPSFDEILGVGGYPPGRVVQLYGQVPELLSWLGLHAAAMGQAQKKKKVVAWIDGRHAFDPREANQIGVVSSEMLVTQPEDAVTGLDIAETMARSGAVDLVVVDQLAALPRAEVLRVGRMAIQAVRKLTSVAHRTNTVVIFLTEPAPGFAPKPVPWWATKRPAAEQSGTLHNALKFYSTIRVQVSAGEPKASAVVKIMKNKLSPPFKSAELLDVDQASGTLLVDGRRYPGA